MLFKNVPKPKLLSAVALGSPKDDQNDGESMRMGTSIPSQGHSRATIPDSCPCFCHHTSSQARTYCYIMYTSGSTTKPKGVCGTEVGLMHRLHWMQQEYPFGPNDVAVFKTSVAFIDHLTELFGPLLGSSLVVVPPPENILKNPLGLLHYLERYHVTRLTTVPSWMRAVLPLLQSQTSNRRELLSLRVVLLSGEALMCWLLEAIRLILPDVLILNLYGSTEVSGDCFSFKCGPLESDWGYTSVPIGKPIPGCAFKISSNENDLNEGELWIGGDLVASGYFNDSDKTSESFTCCLDDPELVNLRFFKTGDYVKKLETGILVYMGRKDRTVKMNGHKVVLDEIENVLQMCPSVAQAAVRFEQRLNSDQNIIAHIVIQSKEETNASRMLKNSEVSESEPSQVEAYLRNWLEERLPFAAIPHRFQILSSLPLLVSGKVDYQALSDASMRISTPVTTSNIGEANSMAIDIKQVFEHVLKMDDISVHDDFFSLGGTSVSAAHAAYILGIDMRLLYRYSSAVALVSVLKAQREEQHSSFSDLDRMRKQKRLKMDYSPSLPPTSVPFSQVTGLANFKPVDFDHGHIWPSVQITEPFVLYRCNVHASRDSETSVKSRTCKVLGESPSLETRSLSTLTVLWKLQLKACIDASPVLLVSKHKCHLFIGSHAHNFACIDARCGSLIWESILGGRVESSAGITLDLSQVVVGCYDGALYFFDCENGALRWKFHTSAEVKCQPTMDSLQGRIWCGSHDHKLYILDAEDKSCVWEHDFKASIFAAPAHDATRGLTYVATTGGSVIALTSESKSLEICWTYQCGAPIFGSPTIVTDLGYAICTMVNGFVLALKPTGLLAWQYKTSGPIFAGACFSQALPSQALVCCRDGWVYSLNVSDGRCLWKHAVGEPITSAAYVDEGLDLIVQENNGCRVHSFRLVCVCGSLGELHVLRVYAGLRASPANSQIEAVDFSKDEVKADDLHENSTHETDENMEGNAKACEHVAALKLPGDVFSSPLMLDGRIFVGCRDNNLYCLQVPELCIWDVKMGGSLSSA